MVFVVGEIGVNWDGNFELAKEMMQNAKNVGCNAVKFQSFNEDIIKNHPEKLRLINATICEDNIDTIIDLSKAVGIEWFCTPMYLEAVDLLNPYVKRFKIREVDSRDLLENKTTKLFEKLLDTKKEIIISSHKSPKTSKFYKNSQLKWLYCVPKYPCNFSDLDFRNIRDFNGYSNHCPHFLAPMTAAILGSKIIEIHITADKTKNFIDNNVSFDYSELEKFMNLLRQLDDMKV